MTDVESDGMEDNERIATDVPDDESNEFDITSLRGVSKEAVNEQTIARIFYGWKEL